MSIIVLGSINTDLVIRGAHLPAPGETVIGGEFAQVSGGKGANQAVAAARAGAQCVTMIGAVGDDQLGRAARSALAAERLDIEPVRTVADVASGVALIMVDDQGENCISVAPGANEHLSPDDIAHLPQDLFDGSRVFLASLEVPLETVRAGLERARSAGVTTVLNPAPSAAGILAENFLQLIDVLTPNEHEASQLSGIEVQDVATAGQAGRRLQKLGCKSVVVTCGAQGSVVVDESTTHVTARSVTPLDTTAAGDALNGALVVALSESRRLVAAVRWAGDAASISVTRAGAQPSLPLRAEIDAIHCTGGG